MPIWGTWHTISAVHLKGGSADKGQSRMLWYSQRRASNDHEISVKNSVQPERQMRYASLDMYDVAVAFGGWIIDENR
jgi:hypothetical protein